MNLQDCKDLLVQELKNKEESKDYLFILSPDDFVKVRNEIVNSISYREEIVSRVDLDTIFTAKIDGFTVHFLRHNTKLPAMMCHLTWMENI